MDCSLANITCPVHFCFVASDLPNCIIRVLWSSNGWGWFDVLPYLSTRSRPSAQVVREAGVLKLVHPGRYVELHRKPVRASEVMEKNPRHFVTRPDVFKFPWIVVRPESVLRPGCIFYIVPCRALYRLLRSSRPSSPPPPPPPHRSTTTMVVPMDPRGDKKAAAVSSSPDTGRSCKSCLKKDQSCGMSSRSRGRGRHRVAFHLPEDHVDEELRESSSDGGCGSDQW